jgi:hypothetical protein
MSCKNVFLNGEAHDGINNRHVSVTADNKKTKDKSASKGRSEIIWIGRSNPKPPLNSTATGYTP